MAIRYHDAATVSDEHGKGAEILRTVSFQEVGNKTWPLLVAEVDCIIRYVTIVANAALTAGTVNVQKRATGSATSTSIIGGATSGVTAAWTPLDLDLDASEATLNKGDILDVTTNALNSNVEYLVTVGWMPNLWSPSADNKTY